VISCQCGDEISVLMAFQLSTAQTVRDQLHPVFGMFSIRVEAVEVAVCATIKKL
jgi:hypothetical protein